MFFLARFRFLINILIFICFGSFVFSSCFLVCLLFFLLMFFLFHYCLFVSFVFLIDIYLSFFFLCHSWFLFTVISFFSLFFLCLSVSLSFFLVPFFILFRPDYFLLCLVHHRYFFSFIVLPLGCCKRNPVVMRRGQKTFPVGLAFPKRPPQVPKPILGFKSTPPKKYKKNNKGVFWEGPNQEDI